MKQIAIALMLCVLPGTAFAQDLVCGGCDHVVPIYKGAGGFIGTPAAGVDEVTFVASCGSVTTTGEIPVQADTVSQSFNRDNGLRCDRDDGTFEIAGLEDGGWYWVNDTWSSAIGNLIAADVLDNEPVEITDPGDSVSISAGMGAAFLKHTASGRIGILPTILPVPEADLGPANVCDYTGAGTTASPYRRETTNCALGDGGTVLRVLGPEDVYAGERSPISPGGRVLRPVATDASVDVKFDLWGNGTGHFTSAETGDARLGHEGGTPLTATFTASYTAGGVDADTAVDAPGGTSESAAGLSIATAADVATLTITPNDDYCSEDNDYSVTVTITADATVPNEVTPAIVELNPPTNNRAAARSVAVVCP